MTHRERLLDLEAVVKSIPMGRVMSYGQVGKLLQRPLSGLLVGRMLRTEGFDGPWWRVVGSKGDLPIDRRGPHYGMEQRRQLKAEGVVIEEDRIPDEFFVRH